MPSLVYPYACRQEARKALYEVATICCNLLESNDLKLYLDLCAR